MGGIGRIARIGEIDGKFILNPTFEQVAVSSMEVVLSATNQGIIMIEAGANIVSEERIAEALEFGIVGANDGSPSRPGTPLCGVKSSGIGREGGRWGVEEYLEVRYVALGEP